MSKPTTKKMMDFLDEIQLLCVQRFFDLWMTKDGYEMFQAIREALEKPKVSRKQINEAMVGFVNHERDIGYCLTEFFSRLGIEVDEKD